EYPQMGGCQYCPRKWAEFFTSIDRFWQGGSVMGFMSIGGHSNKLHLMSAWSPSCEFKYLAARARSVENAASA
ncbi:hypothetical protein, partial [Parasulfitobacter algicola]|uniref:hypothetical protein n=1 Tax=Parasulfitobacter algicola TaxID=2614809 RepID=UPI001C2DE899